MSFPERPRLRSSISGQRDSGDPRFVWLYDAHRVSRQALRIHGEAVPLLSLFDGQNTVLDMQTALMRQGGPLVSADVLQHIAGALDEVLFLEGPRLQGRLAEFLASPVREPACVGSYEEEPEALGRQLNALFAEPKGPGVPADRPPSGDLCGALIPHIDFHRGGHTFAWGFRELVERCDATTFVIMGTAHYGRKRFTLTRKDFRTPLGVAATAKDYVDRIAGHYSDGVFEDELAHLPEHSIEFQVVFLQHCLGKRRPFRIVPLLVGSFQDCVLYEKPPEECEDIGRMIEALREAEAESGEKVCYISSGDLAHIGPKFGDGKAVDAPQLEWSRRQDQQILDRMARTDREGFFEVIVNEADQRRICGFPPTYTLMAALRPENGKLLHYDQYVEPSGFESVSFASLAFYK